MDRNTGTILIDAIGFRNVLAHQYGTIEYDIVYEQLQTGLGVFDAFSQQVAHWYHSSLNAVLQ